MASSGAARGAARGWGVGPAALLGAGEGTQPGRGERGSQTAFNRLQKVGVH